MKNVLKRILLSAGLSAFMLTSCVDDPIEPIDPKPPVDECHDSTLIGTDTVHQGAWMYLDPVCGCDGQTYINGDVARYTYGVINYTKGECGKKRDTTEVPVDTTGCYDPTLIDSTVYYPAVYLPVCGCDGITYSNEMEAKYVYGVKSYISGECGKNNNDSNIVVY